MIGHSSCMFGLVPENGDREIFLVILFVLTCSAIYADVVNVCLHWSDLGDPFVL